MSAMAKRVVGIGALLLCAEAKVDPPRWRLGPAGKSCTDVCKTEKLHCIAGDWPMSAKTMLEKSKSAGVDGVSSSCDNVVRAAASNKIAPFMSTNSGDEECYYQPDVAKITCNEVPSSSQRRYCPCSTSRPQFLLADINISCTEYCHKHGGKCSTDPGTWIPALGAEGIKAMALPLGMGCNGVPAAVTTGPFHAPSIKGDKCYFPEAVQLTDCKVKKDFYRRFCPCIGFEATEVSRKALAGDSIGSSSGQCRGGGFQVGEGTGGAKQLPTGGHRPNSQEECMAQVKQYCHGANGATYNQQTSDCWCEIGMTGYKQTSPHTNVCWFSDGTLAMGSSLVRKYSGFHTDFTAGLPTAAAASCALAMALCAAAAMLVRQRRQRQCDQADGEFLVRLDQDE